MNGLRADYSRPAKLCDLIMKGGITSGVVYPLAICRLAEKYNFKNIGGASAGAIAAAGAAAAESARRNGRPEAFQKLAELPGWLSEKTRLLDMFRPDPSTRPLFEMIFPFFKEGSPVQKTLGMLGAILRNYPIWSLLPVLAWCALALIVFHDSQAWVLACPMIMALLLGVATSAAMILAFPLRKLLTRYLPENFYGMSKGYDPKSSVTDAPLTNWLTSYLNDLAGKDLQQEGPLTFGDLRRANACGAERDIQPPSGIAGVNLEVMTTSLNLGRPYRLPFREGDGRFYFCAEEFAQLFPARVVKHMVDASGASSHGLPGKTLHAFPEADELPVVVAARMSLSFPVLISAVPLYKVDFTRDDRAERPERCWFSDGGSCSNLPIHFFDSPVPRWPTFGIDLKQVAPGHENDDDRVWMPAKPGQGWQDIWSRFEPESGFGSMPKFLMILVETMKGWQDTLLGQMPGYRDRIVHISLTDQEGGLNLGMERERILKLSRWGEQAGAEILKQFEDHYAGGPPKGWDLHRWTRFRSTMNATEEWLLGMLSRLENPLPPDRPLPDTIAERVNTGSYSLERKYEQEFIDGLNKLLDVAQKYKADADRIVAEPREHKDSGGVFAQGAPRPTPELRIRPRV